MLNMCFLLIHRHNVINMGLNSVWAKYIEEKKITERQKTENDNNKHSMTISNNIKISAQ